MHFGFDLYRRSLSKFLFCSMLFLSLACTPAFALPKSPFLGFERESKLNHVLSQGSNFQSSASEFLLPSPSLQISPSNLEISGCFNTIFFDAIRESDYKWIYHLYILLTPVAAVTATAGHFFDNHVMRNVSNIYLYPWLLMPALDAFCNNYEDVCRSNVIAGDRDYDIEFFVNWMGFLGTTAGLILATVGQATDHHRLRNAGNFTYLGGLGFLLPFDLYVLMH